MDYFNEFSKMARDGKRSGNLNYVRGNKGYFIRTYGENAYNDIYKSVKGGADVDQVVDFYDKQLAARQTQAKAPPPIAGSAKWATWPELRKANVLHEGDKISTTPNTYFGAFLNLDPQTKPLPKNWLYWHGPSHLMTIAPTGAGKSSVQIIPNLMYYEGSCFVFDPKGELYKATSFYRSQIGKVYRLAPFEPDSDCFNPLDAISSMDDAIELAQVVFPSEATGDGAFYENEARGFLAALIYLVSFQENSSMGEVRRITALPSDQFREFVKRVAENERMPTAVTRAAALVSGFEAKVISTLQRSLFDKMQVWDSEAIQHVTRKSDFSFADMKTETITVYITVPFHRLEAYSHFIKAIMTIALEAMVSTPERPKIPVLFILDEFLALGHFQRFVRALTTHRDAGVRLWFFLQSVADLEAIYPENWKAFFTATEVKSFFGVRDHYTGQLVSELLGNYTLSYSTTSSSISMSSPNAPTSIFSDDSGNSGQTTRTTNTNTQITGKPLLDPQEVQEFLGQSDPDHKRFGIVDLPAIKPVRVIHLPWYSGYQFWCRFGTKNNETNQSPLLARLWQAFNQDFFDNRLQPPLAIEYQDFSMGRDGRHPTEPGMLAFHDSQHDRIIFMEVCRQVEKAFEITSSSSLEDAQKIADITFAFLSRMLLHEMIHQAAYRLEGKPLDDHGPAFTKQANEVYEKSKLIENGFEFIAPSPAIIDRWPMTLGIEAVLKVLPN